jgi:phage shock protein PspC (stress-responsive transcriptional regulator)
MNETRPCPYCAEDVRAEAIKCRHCGSFLGLRGSPNDWRRSASDRMVAGVCGGLAQQFGVPTAVIRLAFVLMTFFAGGVGLLIYLVLWIVMPSDAWSDEPDEPRARLPERSER